MIAVQVLRDIEHVPVQALALYSYVRVVLGQPSLVKKKFIYAKKNLYK